MRHRPFFERLAAVDPEMPWEWEMLSAGLVTLRLVDRRLDHPISQPTSIEVAAVRGSVRRLPDSPTRRSLRAILDTIPKNLPVADKLVAYGQVLEDLGEFFVAGDVYTLAMETARTEGAAALSLLPHCLDRIGAVARQRGRVDEALRAYEIGRVVAVEIGDMSSALKIDVAMADAFRWRGDVEMARAKLERTVRAARRRALNEPLALALHDLAVITQRDLDYDRALVLYGQALAIQSDRGRLVRLMSDLGVCAWHVGLLETARDAFEFAFTNAVASEPKWHAAIHLMDLAVARGEWEAFDRWVSVIDDAPLPPYQSALFHLNAAEGERRRGRYARAGVMLLIAIEIAERHEYHEIRALARRAEDGQPMRLIPAAKRRALPDDVAAVARQVRAITASRRAG